MRIDVYPKYGKVADSRISGSTVIVIDVLRSTSCIINAVKNGAAQIIPASDPGEAASICNRLGARDCIIAGEVGGIKHPDFNIGNSPLEFTPEVVQNKTIIISTSNGTAAMVGVKGARHVLLGAMSNATAVAKAAGGFADDIIIVCAGTNGNISADDLCAAGAVIAALPNAELSDIAFVCKSMYVAWKAGSLDLSQTAHWKHLVELGFKSDIDFCFTQDTTNVVPRYENGIIGK